MSNYPDGMTSRDWAHIDGDEHHEQCPQHEDFIIGTSESNPVHECECDQYVMTDGDIALERAGL
jgi:hypothetical protein